MFERPPDQGWSTDEEGASDRRHRRWDVEFQTVIELDGEQVSCTVYDLSPSGTCIGKLSQREIDVGTKLSFDLPGFGHVDAEMRYDNDGYHGLKFLHDDAGEAMVAQYLMNVEQDHTPEPVEGAATAVDANSLQDPASLARHSLSGLEERARAASLFLASGSDRDKEFQLSLLQLETVVQELNSRCGRLEEEVEDLRVDRDRIGTLLEALVSHIETNINALPSAGEAAGGDIPASTKSPIIDLTKPQEAKSDSDADVTRDPELAGAKAPVCENEMVDDAASTDEAACADETANDIASAEGKPPEAERSDVELDLRGKYVDGLKRLKRLRAAGSDRSEREAREAPAGGTATIGEQCVPIRNWSPRGFCLGPSTIAPAPGDRLDVDFSIPLPEPLLEFSCRTAVMRHDKDLQEIAGVFFNLDKKTQETIDEHFQAASPKRQPKDVLRNLASALRRG